MNVTPMKMNKTKTLLLALCAITLTGCDMHKDYMNSEDMIKDELPNSMYTIEYNGHSYVVLNYNSAANGITHAPDCPCNHKKVSDE